LKTAGCVAACIGIWFRVNRDYITLIDRIEESDISLKSASIFLGADLLISIGALVAFIGLLGSISTSIENEILLFVVSFSSVFFLFKYSKFYSFFSLKKYSFLLFCIFGLYIGCSGWGFYRLDYLKGIVSDAMRELFNKAMLENINSANYAVNEIQKQVNIINE
jgi:hypothetical protein